MIDYVFRYDPTTQGIGEGPATSEEARKKLIAGNQVFAQWMRRCTRGDLPHEDFQCVVSANGLGPLIARSTDRYPVQKPFAVVLGCSDARVPTEMLFGQGFNDLFVVRVAGNVLGADAQGSIDFSINALGRSVRILVVLGHTNCGAVKGAVEAYLDPKKFWSRAYSPSLRLIFQEIFVAIRESDNAIREVWGEHASTRPGYREALMDMAVCMNAAHTAFSLRQQVEAAGIRDLDVFFGAYNVRSHQVCMPIRPDDGPTDLDPENVNLQTAPSHPRELAEFAIQLAELFKADDAPPSTDPGPRPPEEKAPGTNQDAPT